MPRLPVVSGHELIRLLEVRGIQDRAAKRKPRESPKGNV